MSSTNQYFFTKDKLQSLLDHFNEKYSAEGDRPEFDFKGLVFTPGVNAATGNPCAYAFPLIAFKGKTAGDNESMIVQTVTLETKASAAAGIEREPLTTMGCLVPPPCPIRPPHAPAEEAFIEGTQKAQGVNPASMSDNHCYDL